MSPATVERYRVRLREAMTAIERLRDKLAQEQAKNEPLAIVGLGCRFPGGGDSPEALWEGLLAGVDGVREIPGERWPSHAIPGARPECRWAGLLEQVDGFDAAFFGISRREAERLDPQQRLLLEVTFEALEDAGLRVDRLFGRPVGVFAGLNSLDYQTRLLGRGLGDIDAYTATGNLLSTASGRLSYTFGFQGPCVSIDTACSSSLVAVALACQSLRAGECEVALAGGVTLLLSPHMMAMAAGTQALSPDGRCKVMDAQANGFVRGEGCGVIALKRLADARRDGDRIRAVIPGWAINQDGRSTGLTAPNVRSQELLLRTALARAKVSPAQIDYVEMHGTGTPLGDPIEVAALRAVLGAPRECGEPCVLGAVKSNLGHLEGAAGIAGLIKTVLALERQEIPKNLHFRRLNPRISLAGSCLEVAAERRAWPRGQRRRIAGVSSFGISGTNVHVIVAEVESGADTRVRSAAQPDAAGDEPRESSARPAELIVLSAKSDAALNARALDLRERLAAEPRPLADLAHSLATTRTPMEHRLALVASTTAALLGDLDRASRGETPATGARGEACHGGDGKRAFLFTGQGAQTPGMGRDLYAAWPVFAAAMDACVERFDPLLGRSLAALMRADAGSPEAALLDQTAYTQPALFTLEYALAELWRSWGIEPDLVAGHSIGELAAACFAGVLTLDDATRLVAARGRLMQALPTGGAMISIAATEAEVAEAIGSAASEVSLAAINSPRQVVIAGVAEPTREVAARFAARGAKTRELRVSHAFHSPLIEPMLAEFRRVAASVAFREPARPLVSALTGALAGPEIATADYWVRHAREAVRFAAVVEKLAVTGVRTFIEIGPRPALLSALPASFAVASDETPRLVPSLRGRGDEAVEVMAALGRVWTGGAEVRWSAVAAEGATRIPLPTYPWQRQRYWLDVPTSVSAAGDATGHPLVGVRLASAGAEVVFENTLSLASHPWVGEHRLAERALVPAAALVELMQAACAEAHLQAPGAAAGRGIVLSEVLLRAPLIVPESGARRVQVVLREAGTDAGASVTVYSQPSASSAAAGWVEHAAALASASAGGRREALALDVLRARCPDGVDVERLYARFAGFGVAYGAGFRRLRRLWRGDGEVLAELDPRAIAGDYGIAPNLLDAALQAVLAALPAEEDELRMPFALDRFELVAPGVAPVFVHVRARAVAAELTLLDATGEVVAALSGLRLRAADAAALRGDAPRRRKPLYRLGWRPVERGERSGGGFDAPSGAWLVCAEGAASRERAAFAQALCERLGGVLCRDVAALRAALRGGEAPKVLALWGCEPTHSSPEGQASGGTVAGFRFAQAAVQEGASRLVWITRGAVAVAAGDDVDVRAAPAWGLVRALRLEHPELRPQAIDLDQAEGLSAQVDALIDALAATDDEDQLALRGGARWAARMLEVDAEPEPAVDGPAAPRSLAEGTVVITGGLGALGLHVARWMARRGARHLLLLGRRGLDTPGSSAAVAELEEFGARVSVAAVDVSDRGALARVLEALPEELPVRGVVHCAGVLADALVADLGPAEVARVFAPKVDGAWNLHALLEGAALDFFVLFSSLAGTLGSAGQANYAAANAFLDALAAHRRARGLPGQSLAWGAWSEGGMASALDGALQARLVRLGVGALTPAEGLARFASALASGEPHLAIADFDLARVSRAPGARPLWSELLPAPRASTSTDRGASAARWAQRLRGLSAERRLEVIRAGVAADVARVLAWSGPEPIPAGRPLQELGLDSLMAIELRDALAERCGTPLPATLAFDHPTVDALARWLAEDALVTEIEAERDEPPLLTAAKGPQGADVPIAVIGAGCRLPGGVTDLESLWRLLDSGADAVAEVPRARWDVDAIYDADPDAPGKTYCRSGGFVDGVDQFEPSFFGIAPREAIRMDPQQRLLLETSWEALERAGIDPETLVGSDAGVFVGLMHHEYATLNDDLEALDGYVSTGAAASVASGRLSYVLGCKGPSMTVDTACSSSLVTVHLACQALRQGECSLALAGGVALMLTPTIFVEFSRLRGLAADGRCKSFGAAADGVGWSEGCGMIALKRLPDALRDGDPVLGVIRASAVNQDGRSNGLTAPNGPSQEAVIREALARAGLRPEELDYVECHGTGTTLGDPIEAGALGGVMRGRPPERPLRIGSVKSNIGHTQAAAGVTGILKTLLAFAHERIPKSLHCAEPSPHIDWSSLPLRVVTEPAPWPREAAPRRAGVSSFGVSGTNAHVILEEPPRASAAPRSPEAVRAQPVVLSAKDASALAATAARLRAFLDARPDLALADVAATLARGRAAMAERLALVAASSEELARALAAVDARGLPRGAAVDRARPGGELVFVFSGQGGHWLGMGRQLLREEPAFAERFAACERAILAEAGFSITAELLAEPAASRLDQSAVLQPVLFAVQVSLAALWRAWGIEPDAVVGHSMGEISAAFVAGALSLADAVRVVCLRGRLLMEIRDAGAMALIELNDAEACAEFRGEEARLSVAAVNGPRTTLVAGEPAALDELLARVSARGVFCRRINVRYASHSPQVDPLAPRLLQGLAAIRPRPATIPMWSTVSAEPLSGTELDADYWVTNLRRPVRFAATVEALAAGGSELFVEIGPHPVLTAALAELVGDGLAVGSTRRDVDERRALLESLGALWCRGRGPRWDALLPADATRVALPTYPWQRARYWVDVSAGPSRRRGSHPLLGERLDLSTIPGVHAWEGPLGGGSPRWLADHVVDGVVLLPGAGAVEMALAAAAQLRPAGPLTLTDVRFEEALVLDESRPAQLVTSAAGPDTQTFQIASRRSTGAPWMVHARGTLAAPERSVAAAAVDLDAWRASFAGEPLDAAAIYERLAARGLAYGPAFRGLELLYRGNGRALGRLRLPAGVTDGGRCQLHPALLDACFQALNGALADGASTWLPVEIAALSLLRRPLAGELWCLVELADAGGKPDSLVTRRSADLRVVDSGGSPVVEVRGLVVQEVASRREDDDWFIVQGWERAEVSAPRLPPGGVLLLGGPARLREELRAVLEASGHEVAQAVVSGSDADVEGHGRWRVDDGDTRGIEALLRDAFPTAPPTAIVHLRSLERGRTGDELDIDSALARGCESALHTVQALASRGDRDPPRLWLVTRGAQAVGGSPVVCEQAPLLGLARAIAMEHPELRCACLDLDPAGSTAGEAAKIVLELLADSDEDEIALRGELRQVARLQRRRPEAGRPAGAAWTTRRDGAYLITGGLGGLGLDVASWLAEGGAGEVILVGRSGVVDEGQRAAIAAIEAAGTIVTIARADVTDRSELARVLARTEASPRRLAGVIHAAGVLDDGLLRGLDRARLRRVVAPKIVGALNLHSLTEGYALDLFVLYSSSAALIGAPGQGNYAAANSFLGALAHHRRARGLPCLCVDWGLFAEVGLATSDARGARLETRGLRSLTLAEGRAALARLLASGATQSAVLPIDMRRWVEFFPASATSRRLAPLLEGQGSKGARSTSARALQGRLTGLHGEARRRLLMVTLREEAAAVFRMDAAQLPVDAALTDLGMDSLMGLELRNRLEAACGVRIPATILWTYPTIAGLAEHLAAQLDAATSERASADEGGLIDSDDAAEGDAEGFAEDDLLELLDRSLGRARSKEQGS